MIAVCGEALIDLVPASGDPPGAFVAHPGGGPFNTAVALGRLGVPVSFLGRLSRDAFGQRLAEHLRASAVDLGSTSPCEEPTTLALAAVDDAGRAAYAFYTEGTSAAAVPELPHRALEGVRALHTGSLAVVLKPSAGAVEELLARQHGRRLVSLDPNVRPALIPDRAVYRTRLEGLVARADLVKVSEDDLAWLYPGRPIDDVADGWLSLGAALVVVTLGPAGARAYRGSDRVSRPALPVALVDTIGAGDAFGAGLLAWLADREALDRAHLAGLGGEELDEALGFAAAVAALTCARAGASPPTRDDVRRLLGPG